MPSISDALDLLRPGMSVFIAGSAGEPTALLRAWAKDPERSRGIAVTTSAVPGINHFDFAALHESSTISGPFIHAALAPLERAGRYRHLPHTYWNFVREIAATSFDVVVVQVSPPDGRNRCSLGPAVEFMPAALSRARRILAVINRATPFCAGAPSLSLADFDLAVEVDTPLATYDPGPVDPTSLAIAGEVARLIPDGATLQTGLGKAPTALLQGLAEHTGLRLRGGMFSDGVAMLAEAGALAPDVVHLACVAVGSPNFYQWIADRADFSMRGCEETHDATAFRDADPFVAVNSALEVDLFGQCALEHAGGQAVSGAGGAPDFARATRFARHGLSIVALPATAGSGRSRIVATLSAPGVATLPRFDVDVVVTEHGAADLRGKSTRERADALSAIAAPNFRDDLIANRL